MPKIPRWGWRRRVRFIRRGIRSQDPLTARRYLIVALLCSGLGPSEVARRVHCARSTVGLVRARFLAEGEAGLLDKRAHNGHRKASEPFVAEVRRVLRTSPPAFGWRRPTWTRELLCLTLKDQGFSFVSVATMSRVLHQVRARQGRPKPTVRCPWKASKREWHLARLRGLAARCSAEEPVFYADEVDIHLNPKLGLDWMLRGQQRKVPTPGKNQKHYLAGALHAGTKKLIWVDGASKCSALFCKLVWKVMSHYRRAKRVHFIVDNFIIHASKKTQAFLAQFGERVVLHFLPPYCPDHNRIEREWQDLHANVTRNHRQPSMDELLLHVFAYLEDRQRSRFGLSLLRSLDYAA